MREKVRTSQRPWQVTKPGSIAPAPRTHSRPRNPAAGTPSADNTHDWGLGWEGHVTALWSEHASRGRAANPRPPACPPAGSGQGPLGQAPCSSGRCAEGTERRSQEAKSGTGGQDGEQPRRPESKFNGVDAHFLFRKFPSVSAGWPAASGEAGEWGPGQGQRLSWCVSCAPQDVPASA